MPDPAAPPDIDEQLCFALYRAAHAITRAYREPLQRLGLTYTQYLVLLALWEENPRTMGALAQALDLDMGACTPVVKRMELAELVVRQRDEADERRVLVALDARAADLRGPCAEIQRKIARDTCLAGGELGRLRDQLHAVADSLRRSD